MGITTPTEVPKVQIGDREVTLQSFKAFKGAHVLAMMAEIGDEAKAIAGRYRDFTREYRETHSVRVTEAVASIRGWDVPEVQWKVDDQGGRYVELPESPSDEIAFLEVFEAAWTLARIHVIRVLALLLVDNSELAEAEDEGPEQVAELLDKQGKRLMREAEMWEIVDLAHAARLLIVREMESRAEKVGKLRGLLSTTRLSAQLQAAQDDRTATSEPPTSETQTDGSTGSPTSAQTPTGGPGESRSTESATATSSIS